MTGRIVPLKRSARHGAQRINVKPAGFAKKPGRGHFQPGLGMRGRNKTHGLPVVLCHFDANALPPRRTDAKPLSLRKYLGFAPDSG
jgi:hypothetical protein